MPGTMERSELSCGNPMGWAICEDKGWVAISFTSASSSKSVNCLITAKSLEVSPGKPLIRKLILAWTFCLRWSDIFHCRDHLHGLCLVLQNGSVASAQGGYTFIRSDLLISQGTAKDPAGIQPSWLWNKDGILIGVTGWQQCIVVHFNPQLHF